MPFRVSAWTMGGGMGLTQIQTTRLAALNPRPKHAINSTAMGIHVFLMTVERGTDLRTLPGRRGVALSSTLFIKVQKGASGAIGYRP